MNGNTTEVQLKGGKVIALAKWGDEVPTEHGTTRENREWDESSERPDFYESTKQYMHNDWAKAKMSPVHVVGASVDLLLFYSEQTNTWHSTDALDIDHIVPWKQHLENCGVANEAEAYQAYNDVNNLRASPAFHNRGRGNEDQNIGARILDAHGVDSNEWRKYVHLRIGFDPDKPHPPFDPEKDRARRKDETYETLWTDQDTPSFAARVEGKWFEHRLQESYVGSVVLPCIPEGSTQKVPLFFCSATGQVVTRDALDIDHIVPFETILKSLKTVYGEELSKGRVLDAYNDTENLRVVGRSANSAHEWERAADGGWRDEEIPEEPDEFNDWFDGDAINSANPKINDWIKNYFDGRAHVTERTDFDIPLTILTPRKVQGLSASSNEGLVRMEDAAPQVESNRYREEDGEKEAPPLEKSGPLKRGHYLDQPLLNSPAHADHEGFARMEDAAPQVGRKRYREDDGEKEAPLLEQGGPLKRGHYPDQPLLNSPDHADHAKFLKVMSAIDELKPCPDLLSTSEARENMASYLVLLAADHKLWEITHVVPNDQSPSDRLFAVAGGLNWDTNLWVFSTFEEGVKHSVEDNTRMLARTERPPPLQDPSIPELDQQSKHLI